MHEQAHDCDWGYNNIVTSFSGRAFQTNGVFDNAKYGRFEGAIKSINVLRQARNAGETKDPTCAQATERLIAYVNGD